MKAVRLYENGGPAVLRWEDMELPPPAAGEVRIRHTAIALNFSDINVRRGGFYIAKPPRFPVILGNEAAGIVDSVGPGVTGLKPGERVAYIGTGGPFYEATGSYAESMPRPAASGCCSANGQNTSAPSCWAPSARPRRRRLRRRMAAIIRSSIARRTSSPR